VLNLEEAPKTHKSAVVIIPPPEICGEIQKIRLEHDSSATRWMPHITLIYPFKPQPFFQEYAKKFALVCEKTHPFTIKLSEFCFFKHNDSRYSLWLAPKPKELLVQFQSNILRYSPDCNDVNKNPNGYTPHLTVGQTDNQAALVSLRKSLQLNWEPLEFDIDKIYIISRGDPPQDEFSVAKDIPLGKPLNLANSKSFSTHDMP